MYAGLEDALKSQTYIYRTPYKHTGIEDILKAGRISDLRTRWTTPKRIHVYLKPTFPRHLTSVCTYHRVLKTFSNRFQDRPVRCLHRFWRRLEGSLVNVFRCEDVFKNSSMKTPWRRLHQSWRRLEGSPEDVPLVNGFNCSQRCEDVFKKSSMKTSWRRLQILHLPTGLKGIWPWFDL